MSTQQMVNRSHSGGDEGHAGDVGQGVFHVNKDREGRIAAHGENLSGAEIIKRVGLSPDRYDLFTEEHGRIGRPVPSDEVIPVKPGDHFRATLKGTDYSAVGRVSGE